MIERLLFTWDWKKCISDKFEKPLANHSFYHAFKIVKEGQTTKLRVKRLPQDTVWEPPTGIQIFKHAVTFEPVGCAEFRIEELNIDKVMLDLTKYIKRMPTHLRVSVSNSWAKLRDTLEALPRRQKNFPPMKIIDLPRVVIQESVRLPEEFEFVEEGYENLPEICGKVCEERLFDQSIREGLDVVVYTNNRSGRPWLGRVLNCYDDRTFLIQWFERQGRCLKFRAMFESSKQPYTSRLSNDVVMFWDITVQKSDNSFNLTPYWLTKIMKEYEKYDKKIDFS